MKIEQFPIILGILVALLGVILIIDARKSEGLPPFRERRRRVRAPVDRNGELLVALGCFGMAGALIGRDTWRFSTLSVIFGGVLLLSGALMNRRHLQEMLTFRGAARRADPEEKIENPNEAPVRKNRIR